MHSHCATPFDLVLRRSQNKRDFPCHVNLRTSVASVDDLTVPHARGPAEVRVQSFDTKKRGNPEHEVGGQKE